MASTVTRSQSNRAPLGCGGTGDLHHGSAADKSFCQISKTKILAIRYLNYNIYYINLQQLLDAIMSIWTKISEEFFQHLVEYMPRRIKAVLKAKGSPTRY